MNFMIAGGFSTYASQMKMQMQWQKKQESGSYTAKSDGADSEFEIYREQLEQVRESSDPTRTAIYGKLQSGAELTYEEMEYLRQNDPQAYAKAKEIQAEKEQYEKELKGCKTKEDVERLQTTRLAVRFAVANDIGNNPNIPKGVKMGLLMYENAKAMAVSKATAEFKQSRQYAELPDDEEKREAEKAEAEQLDEEKKVSEETKQEQEPEVPEETEPAGKDSSEPSDSPEDGHSGAGAGEDTGAASQPGAPVSGQKKTEPEKTASSPEGVQISGKAEGKTAAEINARDAYGRSAYRRNSGAEAESVMTGSRLRRRRG